MLPPGPARLRDPQSSVDFVPSPSTDLHRLLDKGQGKL